ncbi:protein of unknown function [Cupriavidus taiwanensis]|uniref:Uncharacterized protein n=1 Tax=Cupriavidus taiwanensis TaxID=164546 RepID=A0A375H3I8_9BURK|nr:hypothetical protein CBM2588_A10066 [Cupriavidus taiwanensis]SOY42352.1 hypothetical protein CBM2592_A10068 [Cupriavidus taiwanensis]SOY78946.1 hypothetical protein CBM2591_A10066 [Cupriavidus taiwanensis]SOZ20760.1 hypothetical protein CBM2608_A10063 [Cupriavidus taiwanensis]SOZ75601.1 hypothetical protein CBM2622_A10017 [Cupriavidus taiwanensis]
MTMPSRSAPAMVASYPDGYPGGGTGGLDWAGRGHAAPPSSAAPSRRRRCPEAGEAQADWHGWDGCDGWDERADTVLGTEGLPMPPVTRRARRERRGEGIIGARGGRAPSVLPPVLRALSMPCPRVCAPQLT